MSGFTGGGLVANWIDASGTLALTGDQKTFSYTPSIDLVDQSAGPDTNKSYITGLKDGRAAISALLQSGTAAGGTLTYGSRLVEGASGTITWYPEGTAAGKTKYTAPFISMGVAFSYPYAENVEVSCDFQQNGARVEGTA